MIKKELRTRDKYAKACAELDVLEKCMTNLENTMALIPAQEIDKIMYMRDKLVAKYKCMLESQAAKDFAGTVRFDEFPVSEIFFKWDRVKDEDYKRGVKELKTAIFREVGVTDINSGDETVYPWISVKDKLPEIDEGEAEVLVFVADGKANGIQIENNIALAYWGEYEDEPAFYGDDCEEITGITHWMYTSWMYSALKPEPTEDGEQNDT